MKNQKRLAITVISIVLGLLVVTMVNAEYSEKHVEKKFQHLDINKNQKVEVTEWVKHFETMDSNKDNQLIYKEIFKAIKNKCKTIAEEDNSHKCKKRKIKAKAKRKIHKMDTNKDKKISLEEWQETFKKVDTNNDNIWSLEELKAKFKKGYKCKKDKKGCKDGKCKENTETSVNHDHSANHK